jgi:type IV pilus assembly protein PilP
MMLIKRSTAQPAAQSTRRVSRHFLPLLLLATLYGCGGSSDLSEWMTEVRQEMRPITPKVDEPKTFEPFIYSNQAEIDPFDPVKITNALRKLSSKSSSGLAPDLNRRKEPLEEFPLDSISMVGILEKPNLRYALLRADNIIYQAKIGNYVGQNFGIVTKITEGDVTLREVVQDASGEWVERISTLQLQESTK